MISLSFFCMFIILSDDLNWLYNPPVSPHIHPSVTYINLIASLFPFGKPGLFLNIFENIQTFFHVVDASTYDLHSNFETKRRAVKIYLRWIEITNKQIKHLLIKILVKRFFNICSFSARFQLKSESVQIVSVEIEISLKEE